MPYKSPVMVNEACARHRFLLTARKETQLKPCCMRIDGPRPPTSSTGAKRSDPAAGGFSLTQSGTAQRANAPIAASAPPSLDALLALQGDVLDQPERRRRQVARAESTLNALDGLAVAILEGSNAGQARAALLRLSQGREPTGDAGLDGLLEDIDVRAAVELAKLERHAAMAV
jgi:hypothetical protein